MAHSGKASIADKAGNTTIMMPADEHDLNLKLDANPEHGANASRASRSDGRS